MAKKSGIILGIIIILVGIIGFIGGWGIVGTTGYFVTGRGLDGIYVILGLVLLITGMGSVRSAVLGLKTVGIIYLLLAIIGFIMSPIFGLVSVTMADNWLHVVLGVVVFLFGYYGGKVVMSAPAPEQL